MPTWAPKDPNARLDYLYTIPLDEGDSVADYSFVKLIGDVVLETESRTGANITAWLSGGTEGELAVFRVEWETAAGRIDDDLILLDIVQDAGELVLTGYAKPAPGHLTLRYPAFADVPPATIRYWLTDAERSVDTSWSEGDYAAALMALAAHNMTLAGQGAEASATSDLPPGITAMKIGTLALSFDSAITRAKATGSLESTRYGSEYLTLLRRNRSGPRVTPTGVLPYDPFARYPHGQA